LAQVGNRMVPAEEGFVLLARRSRMPNSSVDRASADG